jgi:hypothetical protein
LTAPSIRKSTFVTPPLGVAVQTTGPDRVCPLLSDDPPTRDETVKRVSELDAEPEDATVPVQAAIAISRVTKRACGFTCTPS